MIAGFERLDRFALIVALVWSCGALLNTAHAALIAYSDRQVFDAAIAAAVGIKARSEAYDAYAAGLTIADGASLGRLTYVYGNSGNDLAGSGVSIQISSGFGTSSPSNYLGTTDGGVFQSGDDFALSFAPAVGFGLYVISNDLLFDGDITLSSGDFSATLSVGDEQDFTLDDGKVYFLGLVSDSFAFSRVEIRSSCSPCGAFLFNVDDVVVARGIPVPGTLPLTFVALGLAGLGVSRERGCRQQSDPAGAREECP